MHEKGEEAPYLGRREERWEGGWGSLVAGVERGEEGEEVDVGSPSQHTCMHVRERGEKGRRERERRERKRPTSEEERGE